MVFRYSIIPNTGTNNNVISDMTIFTVLSSWHRRCHAGSLGSFECSTALLQKGSGPLVYAYTIQCSAYIHHHHYYYLLSSKADNQFIIQLRIEG